MSPVSCDQPAWLAALLHNPAALGDDVQCLQTHISWVLLAGSRAYKFKKPLSLGFLDFRTLDQRRAACLEELRINRRTAPSIYETVVAVLGPVQQLRLVPLDALEQDAEVLDYGVQMQRFADDQLLTRQLAAGTLTSAHLDTLVQQVAHFHARACATSAGSDWGSSTLVRQQAHANFESLASVPLPDTDRAHLADLRSWTQHEGQRLAPLMAQRQGSGFVRECHGDLHLGNLVLISGQPQLFDAIEFSQALRWIDTVADTAFLFMDLQARGRPDLAWQFLNGWLEHTGDYAALALLPWYAVYRALVRAVVAGLRLAQAGDEATRTDSLKQVQRYLALAQQLRQPRARWLLLAHGVSGSGKSYHSARLAAERGVVRLRADVERKRLFGLAPTAASAGVVPGGIYTPDVTQCTYDHLSVLAAQVLSAGYPVLVDATFLSRAYRAQFVALAVQQHVPCRILSFDAPLDVLRERVECRLRKGGNASEATLVVLEAQLKCREPLDAGEQELAIRVDTSHPVDWVALLPAMD
ncbi:MAG: AAA family ATPase [Comamonas sp.]|uniref:bifunctional aminoglycoside phosphotransferase/ATP-binding protein n=1 Tax=Comamonas sp. TaxID=34028 RepID=UPI0026483B2D|nr:bifunctional aminoglycoside phosphotransferase/ATP-binding protein [Comamonas sp.]MDN5505512.1 AAA family ATPase [Comamonas sp.]MDN5537741.1 AAA family ATPase [Comamonas sp.]